jgi:hypothetical protein
MQYRELKVRQKAYQMASFIYEATKHLLKEELYSSTSQPVGLLFVL